MDTKATVIAITDAVGFDAIRARLGVSDYSIRHARVTGRFPASWFKEMRALCADTALDCPEDIFNFKSPDARVS